MTAAEIYNEMLEWLLEQPWAEHFHQIDQHPRWAEYRALADAEAAARRSRTGGLDEPVRSAKVTRR